MTCHYCKSPLKTGLTFGTCPEFKCGTMYSVESPNRRDQTRKCVEAELAAANARISQLANALEFVVPFCPDLHHPKRYQHKAGDRCPVEEIIRKAKQTRP